MKEDGDADEGMDDDDDEAPPLPQTADELRPDWSLSTAAAANKNQVQ